MGYPVKLQDLVNGVKGGGNAGCEVEIPAAHPIDPMTDTKDWGTRSMQDDPKSHRRRRPECI